MTSTPTRVIYPELPDPLTPGDLQQLFSPSFDERQWAPTVARTAESQVALLVQLKIFQTLGGLSVRFVQNRPLRSIPIAEGLCKSVSTLALGQSDSHQNV